MYGKTYFQYTDEERIMLHQKLASLKLQILTLEQKAEISPFFRNTAAYETLPQRKEEMEQLAAFLSVC